MRSVAPLNDGADDDGSVMPEHLRTAFTGLMGDAREVDALRGEVKRLTGLQSVERLLSTMQAA